MIKKFLLISLLITSSFAAKPELDFSLIKKGKGDGPTLLLIGGIQGDEPGGFTAASLIATEYEITHGNVWIVPNLNFESIIKRSRGVYGDMNRKFSKISPDDPEYETVEKIKKLITDEKVDLIVNLHDGSGFYRETWESKQKNPHRWGQSTIIDQEALEGVRFGDLKKIADDVTNYINTHATKKAFHYRTKNTKTSEGNVEMAKSLTWYAIQNGKPAFGNEASKAFLTHTRAFYHLLAVEGFMNRMGITYEKPFNLAPETVRKVINENVKVALNDKVIFDVTEARNWINYLPMKKGTAQKVKSNNPLTTVVNNGSHYRIHYGNRRMSVIMPEYFEFDDSLEAFEFEVDSQFRTVPFGSVLEVRKEFIARPKEGYRVNVIGFAKQNIKNESGVRINKRDIRKKFSIDKKGTVYRVEVYSEKENKFAGMVLVRFSG